MDRPVVTFDMDGVLCRPPFGINPGTGIGKRRDAPGKKNLLWRTETVRYAFRKPMPGAREGFLAAMELADCKVLSARGEQARGLTERWYRKHFGVVPEIHLRPSWRETSAQFKARKVRELGSVAHFEDDPHTAEWLSELLPRVFLLDWPRNTWLSRDNITRTASVAEAVPALREFLALSRFDESAAEQE